MGMLNYEEHIKEHELIALRYPEKAPVLASNGVTAQTNPLTGGIKFFIGGEITPEPDHWSDHYMNCIVSGFSLPTSGPLASNLPPGVAYVGDYRAVFPGQAVTFQASKDSYIDLSDDGAITITPVANGAAAPAIAPNSMRVGYVTTDATTITGATTGAKDSLGNWMGNRVRAPSCILRRYNNASLGGAVVSLSFPSGTATLDNFYGHDSAAPTKITIAKSGLYRIAFCISTASGIVDAARLKINGSTDIRFPTMFFQSGNLTPQGSFEVFLSAGDYIEMQITPNSGSNPFAYYTYFAATKVG